MRRNDRGLVTIDTGTPVPINPPGTADGIIRFDKPLTEAEYERFVTHWREHWQSASPHGVMILENVPITTKRCAHQNAEPVELVTGEVVAAVCADCLAALPAGWLGCGHGEAIDVTGFGLPPGSEAICNNCGGVFSPA